MLLRRSMALHTHSPTDAGSDLFLLFQRLSARAPRDERHPVRYGSEVHFWALLRPLGPFFQCSCLKQKRTLRLAV
jgi:hypothetical protein